MKNKFKFALGTGALVASAASFAQGTGIDVSSVTTDITSAATAAGVIGLAYLGMVAGVKLYKWVKGAM